MTLRGRIVALERERQAEQHDEQRRAVERPLTPEEHAFSARLAERFGAAMDVAETGYDVAGVTLADAEAIAAPLGGLEALASLELTREYPPPVAVAAFAVVEAQLADLRKARPTV